MSVPTARWSRDLREDGEGRPRRPWLVRRDGLRGRASTALEGGTVRPDRANVPALDWVDVGNVFR
jgi:hypothetical protein